MTKREFLDKIGFQFEVNGVRHAHQEALIFDKTRHRIAVAGRQSGKTIAAAAEALGHAHWGHRVWWVVPAEATKLEGELWVRRFLAKLERYGVRYRSKQSPHLVFYSPTGGILEFRTTGKDPKGAVLVGPALHFLVIEEAARIPQLQRLWDEQLRPTLTIHQGRCLMISTPRGKRSDFYSFYKRALELPTWAVHQFTSFDNPFQREAELDELAAEAGTPTLVQQEIGAEFIEDYGAFFPHIPDLKPETPLLWQGWGWDYAMGGTAAFVKVVEDAAHRLIAVEERAGPLTWEAQVRFAGQQRQAGYDVIVDPHLEETFRADLARHSIVTRPGTSDRRGSLELLRVWLNTDLAGLAPGSCPYLKTELADAEIDERDCEEMTKDARDHAIDAFRYAFIFRWPRAKVYHTPPKSPSDSLEAMIRRMDRAEKVRR